MTRRLLLIGPILTNHYSNVGGSTNIGGTTKSFEILRRYLAETNVNFTTIATNRYSFAFSEVFNLIYAVCKCLLFIPVSKIVMLNVNLRGLQFLLPVIYLYSRIWRCHFVCRVFGGSLIESYEIQSKLMKYVLKITLFKSDIIYLQTKRLVNYFEAFSGNIRWLPTSREAYSGVQINRSYKRKLLFLSWVKETKGIDYVIRFAREHGDSFTVHIYGPILESKYSSLLNEPMYKGVASPSEVTNIMLKYDVLLLPTFHGGEGYPGTIIEANSVGMPVVSTNWLAIPELVLDKKTGLLVTPRSYEEFEQAILNINEHQYSLMSSAALEWFENFNSEKICENILRQMREL